MCARIALFTERNPQSRAWRCSTSARHSGRAEVATRMRLATSQHLLAVAQMNDGSCWQQPVEVIVTLAACVES